MADPRETVFVLTGVDPGSGDGTPGHRRLICLLKDGGKLAVWGRDGDTAHIDAITKVGFPCTVGCVTSDVPAWAEKHGHTHWLEEKAKMRLL